MNSIPISYKDTKKNRLCPLHLVKDQSPTKNQSGMTYNNKEY